MKDEISDDDYKFAENVFMPRNKMLKTPFINFINDYPNLFPLFRLLLHKLNLAIHQELVVNDL